MEDYRLDQSGQEVQEILNGAAMQSELTAETERATEAEQKLQDNIDAEATRAQGAEGTLQDNIDAEETRAKAAEKQNADDIDAIDEKIPSGASSSNKLATEEYVNDSVATATATFRGSYNLVSDLHLNVTATEQQIAAALAGAISTADNNDYCFILVPTSSEAPTEIKEIDRYKFNGTAWGFEYKLNNSGFTAAQWAAINSGITSGDVAKLAALPTNAQLTTLLAGLQSDIDGEETRAKGAEGTLQDNIDAEETRAKAAEKQNADDIDAIEAVIPETASSENKVATESEINSLSAAIEAILLLIPSAATSLNKLADKAFVNSSIATATATFRGTYNLVNDLGLTTSATHAQIATALAGAILTADNNDYAFVQIPTSDAMPTEIAKTERYKFNGTAWEYEYDLNNSGFTSDQWAAINSGITQALVTKLSDLPTNAELTTELGTLTSGITTINQKIPSTASQANKLVDTAAMESYIVEVLNVLTISYNVNSTDGHVTFHIEQVDGKITSVTLATSDIASEAALNLKASQADLTALASRVTTAEGNITTLGGRMTTAEGNITTINGNITSLGGRLTTAESDITTLGGRVSTNETDIANLQQLYNDLQQSKPEPVTALPSTGQQHGVIYRLAGTTSYSDYMWNGSTWVLMATYNNAIDPRPKKASQNLVTSGGVFDNMGALDVSELNATENPHTLAQYVDLSAALAAIPTDYQKGGMSIKFVHSSDNKYVQYRLMSDDWSIDTNDWSFCGNDVYVENPEWLYTLRDSTKKIVFGIRKDGDVYFSKDCPLQIKQFVQSYLSEAIIPLLAGKVDKVEGFSLIDSIFASSQSVIENPEWYKLVRDTDGRIVLGIRKNGDFYSITTEEFINNISSVINALTDLTNGISTKLNIGSNFPIVKGNRLEIFKYSVTNELRNQENTDLILSGASDTTGVTNGRFRENCYFFDAQNNSSSFNLTAELWDKNFGKKESKQIHILPIAKKSSPAASKNILIIGDSWTNNDTWCKELNRRLTGTGGTPTADGLTNLTFIGTQCTESGQTPNESAGGRGWLSYIDANSPFYFNGSIDFDAYCTENGYDGIDYVLILLGANQLTTESIGQARELITIIHSYNASIKILVGSNAMKFNPYGWSDGMGLGVGIHSLRPNYDWVSYNNDLESLCKEYSTYCFYVDVPSQIDIINNFKYEEVDANNRNSVVKVKQGIDNVHPDNSAYLQVADAFYNAFHYFCL